MNKYAVTIHATEDIVIEVTAKDEEEAEQEAIYIFESEEAISCSTGSSYDIYPEEIKLIEENIDKEE